MDKLKKTILIVDDSIFSRKLLNTFISTNKDFEIMDECKDGREAVEKNKDLLPNIVFLDIIMPMLSGIDCIPFLIKDNPDVKIIICSAANEMRTEEYIKMGAFMFIHKPFEKDTITKILNILYLME